MTQRTLALVTGGSRGLGRSTVRHLAAAGVDVLLTYRSDEVAAKAAVAEAEEAGVRAAALPLDQSSLEGVPAFAEAVRSTLTGHFGRTDLDHLVNNAGTGLLRPLAETTDAELADLLTVHVEAPFALTRELLPTVRDGGRILFTSSGLTRFTAPGGHGAYAAAKAAVEVLARYLALELGPRGITVNTIAPGAVETDFNGGAVRGNPDLWREIAATTALGRPGLPDDVGAAVATFLTGPTGWITGQRIEVSGGQRL